MLDYQRIVDDVRSLIGSQNAEEMDFLRAAAADYSVAADEVNERLGQCGSLLRKGLRSEAIQLGEMEPNLLDVVALLDFPERSAWTETANRCGIAPPPALLLDVAAALNEAYALEQPLAALLQQHRLLALTHGSLPARIQVLRRLAELDVNNAVWQEDLQVFEKERQKQIQAEVEAAARAGTRPHWRHSTRNFPTLAGGIYPRRNWLSRPPRHIHGCGYWAVQSQFDQLAKELADAMSGYRVELGRTLRDRWNENIATSGWQPQEPIANRAAPALNWLNEQDEIDRRQEEHVAATRCVGRGRRSRAITFGVAGTAPPRRQTGHVAQRSGRALPFPVSTITTCGPAAAVAATGWDRCRRARGDCRRRNDCLLPALRAAGGRGRKRTYFSCANTAILKRQTLCCISNRNKSNRTLAFRSWSRNCRRTSRRTRFDKRSSLRELMPPIIGWKRCKKT